MKNLSFDNFSSEKKLSPERKRYITSLARKALVNTLETF